MLPELHFTIGKSISIEVEEGVTLSLTRVETEDGSMKLKVLRSD